ncbi:hypothetical protein QR680_006210 [Steinernema hermaphroditum]|uniref:Inosine/uridine-preferring nucleoside hydrolase domain-containing protein n=1 Tax=Steinernema hermaphroditum TaxID=289476 RepID=A0AA39HUP1_9BILA|nr:hypothetical protein QR680_006210 [Steinernema hermaphroditum]
MRIKTKLIIDTDGLSDDVRAISLALQNQATEVVSITATHGCISVDQVVANISRTLRANRKKVPIYKGAANPFLLKETPLDETSLFGKDGISDRPHDFPEAIPGDFSSFEPNKHAAQALIELCRDHSDMTIVCLGALTNIALALKLDPSFAGMPKKVVIMGGNYYAIGNVGSTLTAEFNFFGDPEAAQIVLSEMECPITVVPWEAFFIEGKKHEREVDFEAHLKLGTPLSNYLSLVTSVGREIMGRNGRQFAYCDEIAVAAAIDPENVVAKSQKFRVSVELNGKHTRGQVAVDWTRPLFEEENVDGLNKFDVSRRFIEFVTSYNVKWVDQMMHEAVLNSK